MYRKIGEKFEIDGKVYQVTECGQWHSCRCCAFQKNGHPGACTDNACALMDRTGECNGMVRGDGKYVYFAAL
jgi:hypothetical protein